MDKETAFEAWESLRTQFEATSKDQLFKICTEFLHSAGFQERISPTHIAKLRSLWNELNNGLEAREENAINITGQSSSVAFPITEHGSTALFLWSENTNQPGVKKLTSEVLTESERKSTMPEKAGKVKTNKKLSKKQKKKMCQFVILKRRNSIRSGMSCGPPVRKLWPVDTFKI
ncbi:zinc knuckle protein [Trichonephila clavipes]|nr:zinc knuckle protein [Trichonephila clavipes]